MNLFCKLKSFFCPPDQSSVEEERQSFVHISQSLKSQVVSKPIPKRLRLLSDLEKYYQDEVFVQDKLPILTYIEPRSAKPQLQEIVKDMNVIETPKWVAQNQFNFNKKSIQKQKENIQIEQSNDIGSCQINLITNRQSNYSFARLDPSKSMPQKSSSKNSQLINSTINNNYHPKKVFKFEFEELQQQTECAKSNQQEIPKIIEDQVESNYNSEYSIQQEQKK